MTSTVNLLLVEDDEIDIQGFKRAFAKSRIGNPVVVAKDGVEALDRRVEPGRHPRRRLLQRRILRFRLGERRDQPFALGVIAASMTYRALEARHREL